MARPKGSKNKPKPEPRPAADTPEGERYDLLRRWRWRVARAKKIREDWQTRFQVERCERYFLGQQRPEGDAESLVLNYFLSTVKTQAPNLFFSNPKFYLQSKGGKYAPIEQQDARIGEGILEAIAEQDGNLEAAVRLSLSQAFFRIGALKIVYDPKMEPNPRKGQPIYLTDSAGNPVVDTKKLRPLVDPATGQPMVDPQSNQPVPDPDSIEYMQMTDSSGQPMVEPDEVPTDETYRWAWVNAKRMLLADEGPDQSVWTWVGEEVSVSLEDAKQDPRFKKEYREQLVANETADPQSRRVLDADADSGIDEETKRLRYYECYDAKKKKLAIFCDGQQFDDFLLYDDLPDGIEDHPYSLLLGFTPIIAPEPSPWPLPHTFSWLDCQQDYNTDRTLMSEGAKRSARKFVYTEGTFDDYDEAVKLLQSPKDMEGAKIADMTQRPQILEAPDLNPSIYKNVAAIQYDWQVLTGQSGAKLAAPNAETATEATFVERASNIRDLDMQQQVTTWLATAGRKMLQRVKATMTLEMWIRLRGFSDKEFQDYVARVYGLSPTEMIYYPGLKEQFRERFGADKWKNVTRDDIDFEADVSVAPGSSRPKSLDSDRRSFLQLLQLFGQAPQLLMSRELTARVLRMFEMYDERLLDELTLVAQKMIQVNANQAGRNQGQTAEATATPGVDLSGLAGMLSGAAVRPS